MQASVYIATSLDGFIAREDGALDWLPGADGTGADQGEDYGYAAFMATVDALVMGRKTYEMVRSFGDWPYRVPVSVLSSRPLDVPEDLQGKVERQSGEPREIVAAWAHRGAKHLYVDGGRTIQQFLAARLIDRLILTRIPVLLGQGIPLFGPLPHDLRLRHTETTSYPSGLVQSSYEVVG